MARFRRSRSRHRVGRMRRSKGRFHRGRRVKRYGVSRGGIRL